MDNLVFSSIKGILRALPHAHFNGFHTQSPQDVETRKSKRRSVRISASTQSSLSAQSRSSIETADGAFAWCCRDASFFPLWWPSTRFHSPFSHGLTSFPPTGSTMHLLEVYNVQRKKLGNASSLRVLPNAQVINVQSQPPHHIETRKSKRRKVRKSDSIRRPVSFSEVVVIRRRCLRICAVLRESFSSS
jgi:hypothetical protein